MVNLKALEIRNLNCTPMSSKHWFHAVVWCDWIKCWCMDLGVCDNYDLIVSTYMWSAEMWPIFCGLVWVGDFSAKISALFMHKWHHLLLQPSVECLCKSEHHQLHFPARLANLPKHFQQGLCSSEHFLYFTGFFLCRSSPTICSWKLLLQWHSFCGPASFS